MNEDPRALNMVALYCRYIGMEMTAVTPNCIFCSNSSGVLSFC